MVTRRKKSVRTHAVALWSIVGICVVLLVMMSAYVALVTRISAGTRLANSSQNTAGTATQPSLFGTVVTILASDAISIESKQPFDTVLIDEITKISALGGSPFQWSDLRPGATLTATGKDLGDGRLTANAIVILANPGTALSAIGAPPGGEAIGLLQAPSDWSKWATMPVVIGWGSYSTSKYFLAVRDFDAKAPAVSVLIFGVDGTVTERIELDVPGYKHLKPLNDFLTPTQAEKKLQEMGFIASNSLESTVPPGKSGSIFVLKVSVDAQTGKRTYRLTEPK